MTETTLDVVTDILERAEHLPWKIRAALETKLVPVLMRQKGLSYLEAQDEVDEIVVKLGFLADDADMNMVASRLQKLINL